MVAGDQAVTRQTESGDEVIDVPLPALVSVGDSINEPRYTSLKGVMAAKKKPLETLAVADLGVDARRRAGRGPHPVLVLGAPPPGAVHPDRGRVRAAQAIVEFLVDRQLV